MIRATDCQNIGYETARLRVLGIGLALAFGLFLACAGESARQDTDRSSEVQRPTEVTRDDASRDSANEAGPSVTGSSDTAERSAKPAAAEFGPTLDAGVEGLVTIGPACPVPKADEPCPEAPYSARIVVREAATGDIVVTFSSGEDGSFRVSLPPGDYILDPGEPEMVFDPRGEPVRVKVEAHRYSHVVVRFDSGVR